MAAYKQFQQINKRMLLIIIAVTSLLMNMYTAFADIRLPHLISDGMVLQRNTKLNIWGWATPAEKIRVQFIGHVYKTVTGNDGKWSITFPAIKAGGPYSMTMDGNNHLVLNDILIGEVWVCSGQSNMTIPMERVKEKYPEEIAGSENTFIRHFFLPTRYNFNQPEEDTSPGKWEAANPLSVLRFTAAGYFFASAVYEKYPIAIGLINASVGGTPVESWMSTDALKAFPHYLAIAEKFKDSLYADSIKKIHAAINGKWQEYIKQTDSGLHDDKPWYDTLYNASGWQTMQIPGYWDEQGLKNVNGVVWFRKVIEVPASMTGKPAKLFMGRIIDADDLYVNGSLVANTTYQYPPRRYEIPAGLLKPGKNIITVRVISNTGKGGFVIDKPYYLSTGDVKIDLKSSWQYKLGVSVPPLQNNTPNITYQPSGLFNGMIAPLLNYAIKGILWYQGESNTDRAADYHELFAAMIKDWRKQWQLGDIPFLYVQLPNYGDTNSNPSESNWASLREQQLKTLTVSNTAMVVAIDIGEWNDLHPLNKKDIGKRLALAARHLAYGEKKLVYSGPLYQSMNIEDNKIILSFQHTGSGLIAKGNNNLQQFAIAGADKKFAWAKAKINAGNIIVWNDNIAHPLYVRYAWAHNPRGANLYNKEGLPASPFRTDE
jgi:sialate O-acetylesterase